VAQGFPDAFQTVQDRDGGKDVRGIRALAPAGLDEVLLAEAFEQGVKEQAFGLTSEQPTPKFAEHGRIKAGII
jgi:hypothetical protein